MNVNYLSIYLPLNWYIHKQLNQYLQNKIRINNQTKLNL